MEDKSRRVRGVGVVGCLLLASLGATGAGAAQKYVGVHYQAWFTPDYDWGRVWDPESFGHGFDLGTFTWSTTGSAFDSKAMFSFHGSMAGGEGGWGDSFQGGEQATGTLKSRMFKLQSNTLTFKAAGWDGASGTDNKNYYRLLRASDNVVLKSAKPPQSDTFTSVSWDVGACVGQDVYFEIVDGHSGNGYAWLAVDSVTNGALVFDFEDEESQFDLWGTSGTAFGYSPSKTPHGSLSGWESGFWADSFNSPRGETATGKLRTRNFKINGGFVRFLAAGWDGVNGTDNKNFFYLRRASDGSILISAKPPQSDTFTAVQWNVSAYPDVDVYLEAVDNNANTSYAWLALDSFKYDQLPEVVQPAIGFYVSDFETGQAHANMLKEMGVDFVMIDETNNTIWGTDDPIWEIDNPANPTDFIYKKTLEIARGFASVPGGPKVALLLAITTWDSDVSRVQRLTTKNYTGCTNNVEPCMKYPWIPSNAGDLWVQKVGMVYTDLAKYPAKYFYYEGKPLLFLFVSGTGTVYDENGIDQTIDGKLPDTWDPVIPNTGGQTLRQLFTIRWVGSDMSGTGNHKFVPSTGDTLEAYRGHWSWEDGTPQTWASRANSVGATPEAMTNSAFARSPVLQGRNSGQTFRTMWERSFNVDPIFAIIHTWNEFSTGDEYSPEYSQSIEPTTNYFKDAYKTAAKSYIAHFKKYRMDLALYDTASGGRKVYFRNRTGDYSGQDFNFDFQTVYVDDLGTSGVEVVGGDFNGDGKTDYALRNIDTGLVSIRFAPYFSERAISPIPGPKVRSLEAGTRYKMFAGDFNKDGKADLGFYDSVGNWLSGPGFIIRYNDGSSNFSTVFAWRWTLSGSYQYGSADVNGDGWWDIVYRDPSTGAITFALSGTDGLQSKPTVFYSYNWTYGSHYQLFTGNVDGDAYHDIGLRDPVIGRFYMLKNLASTTGSTWNFSNQMEFDWARGSQYVPFTGDFR